MCIGVPMQVITVEGSRAIVETGTGRREVDASFVRLRPGDFVYVQYGIVLEVLDPDEAQRIFDALREAA